MLLEPFTRQLTKEPLWPPDARLLVAVSGGMDSVALADLLFRAGYALGLAHVNFQLRAEASDADAALVEAMARQYGLPYFEARFDTLALRLPGESVQMVARRLRYHWLEEVRLREGYDYILTAHHAHDNLETLLMRFTQGCGLAGLGGIPPVNGRVLRPLLPFTRTAIAEYVAERGLPFREDASNASDYYLRNKIRRHVTPALEAIQPGVALTAAENARRFREAHALYAYAVATLREQCVRPAGEGSFDIDMAALRAAPSAQTLLFEWLSPLGFTAEQCRQALSAAIGTLLAAESHTLLVTAEACRIRPRVGEGARYAPAVFPVGELDLSPTERLSWMLVAERPELEADPNVAVVDADLLHWPLVLRRWTAGDWFCPLGMQGRRQKLQDFFVNQKIDRQQRQRQWLCQNANGDVVWVVGRRLDDRYKITANTSRYVILRYLCTD
jgi:tRNA(Ile)-lysidine synthase